MQAIALGELGSPCWELISHFDPKLLGGLGETSAILLTHILIRPARAGSQSPLRQEDGSMPTLRATPA
jgi:hypothetical protein